MSAALSPSASHEQQARYAAHFLATRMKANGNHLNFPASTFADTGNTIDAILALDASGTGGAAAEAATTWVGKNARDYVAFGGGPLSGGGAGKVLVLAASTNRSPDAFVNGLVGDLQQLLTATGRFGSSSNDYAVTINQALAMIGLQRAGAGVPPASLTYLAAQQCANGGVRGTLDKAPCTADPDATAFATQAFLSAGETARAGRALDYLESQQRSDGGLANSSGEGANANTTGVAAQAFALGGRRAAYRAGASFILGLQWGCEVAEPNRGGIAFTLKTMSTKQENVDSAIRATPQATLGLLAGSLVTVASGAATADTLAMPCAAAPMPASAPPVPSATPAPSAPSAPSAPDPSTVGEPAEPMAAVAVASAAGGPSALADTGVEVWPTALTGLVLLLAGAGAVGLSRVRRRGGHA
ncbi:MAG TPA: hypothetical protein VES95_10900 [Dermatophilaceae bacterium]|nr:hypothetical protein [Dermatophilaceae bacterium]